MLTDDEIVAIIKAEETDAMSYTAEDSELNSMRATIIDYYDQKPYGTEKEGKSSIVTSELFQVVEGMIPSLMALFLQNRNVAEFKPTRRETQVEKIKRKREITKQAQQIQQQAQAQAQRIMQQAQMLAGQITEEQVAEQMKSIQEQAGAALEKLQNVPGDIYEQEAQEKTALANYVFTQENNHEEILYSMFKDGLMAITGWVQVYYDETDETEVDKLTGLSEIEVEMLREDKDSTITEEEQDEDGTFSVVVTTKYDKKCIKVENIPYEECVISRRARNFDNPPLIGQKMLKTRGEIKAMELASDEVIDQLSIDYTETNRVKQARHGEYGENSENLQGNLDRSMDRLWLRRYYMYVDVDKDGIAELWEFFYCNNQLLKKSRVYDHPYCVFVPIPTPHRAIGTSPIWHMHTYQRWMSALVRQWNDNIWQVNHPRYFLSNRVNRDHWNAPSSGQGIEVKGESIGDAAQMVPTDNQGQQIMMAIDFVQSMIEKTTGYTAHNQGLDSDSMNKTATGVLRLEEKGNMRMEVIARHGAVTIEKIYNKIVKLLAYHQDTEKQIMAGGEELTINPKKWGKESRCHVDVGIGSGARQEAVQNLSFLLEQAKYFLQIGSPVVDSVKIYNLLDRIAIQMGHKNADEFFNNIEKPGEALQAENEKLMAAVQQMQAVLEEKNPLADAEKVKAQVAMAKLKAEMQNKSKDRQSKMSIDQAKLDQDMQIKIAELGFDREKLKTDTSVKLTDLQLQTEKNVKGDMING